MERVGFGSRLLAAIIDVVIMLIVVAVLGSILGVSAISTTTMTDGAGGAATTSFGLTVGIIIIALIPIGYTVLEIVKAATPGKMALGLVIRNADGSVAPTDVLAKRWAVKQSSTLLRALGAITTLSVFTLLGTIAGLVIFIGCFFVLSDTKQALHDKVANTAVYKGAATAVTPSV